jgi:predicted regulator of Ras-like GTPase activity (Roadblock/LC7/MglB family)
VNPTRVPSPSAADASAGTTNVASPAQRLQSLLADFLDKTQATFSLVIDRGGSILCQYGDLSESIDSTILAALAAGSFAATKELAARLGEAEFNTLHHQGKNANILVSTVDDDAVLMTVFGPETTVGLVKFYSVGTVTCLAALLKEARTSPDSQVAVSRHDLTAVGNIFPQ